MSEDTPIWKKYPEQVLKRLRKVSAMRIIPVVFGLIIFVGAFLLMLPVSSRAGNWTDFTDALFTATSATCVTGLIRFDTYTYWSTFGQIVILCMIPHTNSKILNIFRIFFVNKLLSSYKV